MATIILPTAPTKVGSRGPWKSFLDNIKAGLENDTTSTEFVIVTYALTLDGWILLKDSIQSWRKRRTGRRVIAFVGTDHGISTPEALEQILHDCDKAYHVSAAPSCFHPKIFLLRGPSGMKLWSGSNNFTKAGLSKNMEFGTQVDLPVSHRELKQWLDQIQSVSTELDQALIEIYKKARKAWAKSMGSSESFHWTPRHSTSPAASDVVEESVYFSEVGHRAGDLILQVTPRETGGGGNQIQFPIDAVRNYFRNSARLGARFRGDFRIIGSLSWDSRVPMVYDNDTIRITIPELSISDRPCLIAFRKLAVGEFEYEIIRENSTPIRYRDLLGLCNKQTNRYSRKWGIVPNACD